MFSYIMLYMTTILFDAIREHKWNKLKQLINSNIDLNLKDINNNYLLSYAVKFGKLDIVKLLIENNARYDIVDIERKSVIYDAIMNGYIDIVKFLLDISKTTLGISIIDIQDNNGNIPLHYALFNNNLEMVELFVKNNSDVHLYDNKGFHALYYAVKTNNSKIMKQIITSTTKIDLRTLKGHTSLHIALQYQYYDIVNILLENKASVYTQDTKDFSPLHYAVAWNNINIVKLLMTNNADPNIQDIYGNTPLFYCVKEDYVECFDYIMTTYKKPIDLNLWNIDGKTILHDVLEPFDNTKQHYVDVLIKNTSLHIQDINGNTCMHHLITSKLWKIYKDILRTKKINIFATNYKGIAVVDLLYSNDNPEKILQYKEFIDIVTESYLYVLSNMKRNWKDELDKLCSRNIGDFKKIDIDNNDAFNKHKQKCFILIKNKIENNIKLYYEGKLEFCQRSYPLKQYNVINLDEGNCVEICTYTGAIIDVLVGLMYILTKHKHACTTLGKTVNVTDNLCKFYKSMNYVMNGKCEFIEFEIVWIEYKLYMDENFIDNFNNCIKSSARFVIIPIGIECKTSSHANYLIYDKLVKELERFEPHGGTMPIGFNYNAKQLDYVLKVYFTSIDKNITYITPYEYLPKIGFQIMESQETGNIRIGDPGGFCALWAVWYVDQRLTYYTFSRKDLVQNLFKYIKEQRISYKNMIRNYSRVIIAERDNLLAKADIDINTWINDTYTHEQSDKLLKILISKLKQCCITN